MEYRLGLSAEPIDSTIDDRLQGVGLVRGEYLCRQIEEYVTLESCRSHIANYLRCVCRVFYPREVWYRTTDLVSPEVNVLRGADHVIEEKHYVSGLRGLRRSLKFPEAFQLELLTVSTVASEWSNLKILLPYIYDPTELDAAKIYLEEAGYRGSLGIMAEVPSVLIKLEEFASRGIANVTLGMNDLTSLMLGTYRGSDYHNHCHPALIWCIRRALEVARPMGIKVSVAGYLSKGIEAICESQGVDAFIVHYSELSTVLGVNSNLTPYASMLSDIKMLTKRRIVERQNRLCE